MTRDEILTMKPGRELDALVAEKVMGFRCVVDKGNGNVSWIAYGVYGENHTPPMAWKKWNYKVPPYSTDIAAALEVAIHLQKQGYYVCIDLKACEETSVGVYEENPAEQIAYAKAQTPAEAICKAALLAVMEGEKDD